MSTPIDKKTNIIPEENAVSSETGFSGPHPRPRDKSPEHTYNTEVGEQAAIVGPKKKGGGAVNIRVKGAAGDAPGQPDELAEPDAGVTAETKRKTTGDGKVGVSGIPKT